jgi:Flp pilus assembly protein TadG
MEMAMVVPVFFFLVFGIIEVGRGFMVSHLLANAARDGCRAGTIEGTSTEEIRTIVTEKLAAMGVQGATVSVEVNGTAQEAATAGAGAKISVGATIPVSAFTWLPGGSFLKGSLGGEYSLHRE